MRGNPMFGNLTISHILRLCLAGFSLYVLSGIVPISLAHWQTGNACPDLGPIPACYVVSVCYAAMGIVAILWNRPLSWLFFAGVAPVILLALVGSLLELTGHPTCPRSDAGLPLCYMSLFVGVMMLLVFLYVLKRERK